MIERTIREGYSFYRLSNDRLRVQLCDLGAAITEIRFLGRCVTLGYDSPEDYLRGTNYVGAVIGRVANRIGGGQFTLGGRRRQLDRNENGNTLHGGSGSFDKRRWESGIDGESVCFRLVSPDLDNGFPGTMEMTAVYTLSGSELRLDLEAVSDADTYFAPTSHSYFNLDGAEDIRGTLLQINASGVTEVDGELIPTGRILPAEGDLDFSRPRPIGRDYDHCFCISGEPACTAAAGGIRLTILSDMPGLQLYTGAGLSNGLHPHQGFALEPCFYPDTPNNPAFPSCLLRRGERARHTIRLRFSECP